MAKKKINDDKLLQLIRDGNSPAEAARFFVGGKLRKCSAREDETRHQLQPSCQCTSFRIFQHIICIPGVGPIVHRIAPLCFSSSASWIDVRGSHSREKISSPCPSASPRENFAASRGKLPPLQWRRRCCWKSDGSRSKMPRSVVGGLWSVAGNRFLLGPRTED